jgi:hypothetical protein
MMNAFRIGPAFVVMLCFLQQNGVAEDKKPSDAPQWEQILEWLPEDTETIIVSQVSSKIAAKESANERVPLLVAMARGQLLDLKQSLARKALQDHTLVCAVEGSRCFKQPGTRSNLGAFRYEGCHVLQFDARSDDAVKGAFKLLLEKADKTIQLADEQVAVFSEDDNGATWTFFVSRPRAGILVCATDQSYLEETLKRFAHRAKSRALPKEIPEWKVVDVNAPVWALRHYRKETAEKDATSPLKGGYPVANDPAALGFIVWCDSGKTAHARYLSSAKGVIAKVKKGWYDEKSGRNPTIEEEVPGVVKIEFKMRGQEEDLENSLLLLFSLGHGVFL